jgi:predicted amidohydrolase
MCSVEDYKENLAFADKMLAESSQRGQIDLLAFPETFLYVGQDHSAKHAVAARLEKEIIPHFQNQAARYHCAILLGSVYEPSSEPDKLYNTSILIDERGELKARYRKMHMCDAPQLGYLESSGIIPGDEVVTVDSKIGKLGLTICYDLRFPELFRTLSSHGAEVVFVPAAFFLHTGKHHWLPLLIARAIENQIYIVAPNQWGKHYDTRISYGSSVIIDPWGSVICCASEQPGLTVGAIDLSYLRQVRENMPYQSHRRNELYV